MVYKTRVDGRYGRCDSGYFHHGGIHRVNRPYPFPGIELVIRRVNK